MSPLLLAAAVLLGPVSHCHASTQTYNFSEPSFWLRNYWFPEQYETYLIELGVEDVSETRRRVSQILREAGAQPAPPEYENRLLQNETVSRRSDDGRFYQTFGQTKPNAPGDDSSLWQVPGAVAEQTAQKLPPLGILMKYQKNDQRPKNGLDPEELYYKDRNLRAELPIIQSSQKDLPGIHGLLQEQLKNVANLIKQYEKAKANALLRVNLRSPK